MLLMTETVAEKSGLFERFAPLIRALPDRERLTKADLLVPDFRLYHDGQLEVYYAPVDYVNETAKGCSSALRPDGPKWRSPIDRRAKTCSPASPQPKSAAAS